MNAPISDHEMPWGCYRLSGYRLLLRNFLVFLPSFGLCRRVALWLRRPLKYGIHTPVDVELWGLKLRLMPRGNLCEERLISLPQFFDSQERRFLSEKLGSGSTFIDLGANVGSYSLWTYSSIGRDARIHAIEPDPQLCQRLRFNLETNNIKAIRVHPVAVSDHEGEACLQIADRNRGTSKLGAAAGGGLKVRVTTLQAFLEEQSVKTVDALKIDIEGHEAAVLRPFFEKAPRSLWPRFVICESLKKGGTTGAAAVIESAGYHLVRLTRMNALYALADSPAAARGMA